MTWAPKVVTAVALYLGGYMVLDGQMKAGDFVAFMLYQQALAQQCNYLLDFMSPVTQAIGAIDEVLEIMKRRPKVSLLCNVLCTPIECNREVVLCNLGP